MITVSQGCITVTGAWLRQVGPCLIYEVSFKTDVSVHAALHYHGCGEVAILVSPWSFDLFGTASEGASLPTFLTFPLPSGYEPAATSTTSNGNLTVVLCPVGAGVSEKVAFRPE